MLQKNNLNSKAIPTKKKNSVKSDNVLPEFPSLKIMNFYGFVVNNRNKILPQLSVVGGQLSCRLKPCLQRHAR